MTSRNYLNKPAQFSFAADLFMLQAILRLEEGQEDKSSLLEYTFPRACFYQIINWILDNPKSIGLKPFEVVNIQEDVNEIRVTFPNEEDQDKMHQFFSIFNQKRKEAQGFDKSFPPMPDIYQGGPKPVVHVIERYMALIADAFDGDSDIVLIPSGPHGTEFEYKCI